MKIKKSFIKSIQIQDDMFVKVNAGYKERKDFVILRHIITIPGTQDTNEYKKAKKTTLKKRIDKCRMVLSQKVIPSKKHNSIVVFE